MRIVSAYYRIPSKKPHEFYIPHLTRFFEYLETQPITFFTDEETARDLRQLAGPNVDFRIQSFDQLAVFKDYPPEFWKRQKERDPEEYHTWQVGAVWANKKYWLKEASDTHLEENWFVWLDSGSIRIPYWQFYLDKFSYRNRFEVPGIYYQLINPVPSVKQFFRFPDIYISGAIILAHREYINPYIQEYNKVLDLYDKEGVPAIMDQYCMMSIQVPWITCVEYTPDLIVPDKWFFFLAIL